MRKTPSLKGRETGSSRAATLVYNACLTKGEGLKIMIDSAAGSCNVLSLDSEVCVRHLERTERSARNGPKEE